MGFAMAGETLSGVSVLQMAYFGAWTIGGPATILLLSPGDQAMEEVSLPLQPSSTLFNPPPASHSPPGHRVQRLRKTGLVDDATLAQNRARSSAQVCVCPPGNCSKLL
jgi:hypothetical protein